MQRGAARLLIVDDEDAILEMLRRVFEVEGFAVSTASCGWDAIELIEKEKFDFVLSDVRMSRGDGIELLEKIEEISDPARRPIVALMSAYTDVQPPEVFDRGGVALIDKPFKSNELARLLKSCLVAQTERWLPGTDAKPPTVRVSLAFGEFAETLRRGEVALGRGGLFVAMAGSLPRVDQVVAFSVRFDGAQPLTLAGTAKVAWTRPAARHGFHAGLGLEFATLAPTSRAFVLDEIATQSPRAYIPIGLKPTFVKAAT